MLPRIVVLASIFALAASVAAQAADGFSTRVSPNPERAKLIPPPSVWQNVLKSVGHEGRPLGYSYDTMQGFPQYPRRVREVDNLFRDVLLVPEYGGLMGDNFLTSSGSLYQLAYLAWGRLDARAGREWATPKDAKDWKGLLSNPSADPLETLQRAIQSSYVQLDSSRRIITPEQERSLHALGDGPIRLAARLVAAANLVAPYFRAARQDSIVELARPRGSRTMDRKDVYDMLVAPYLGDVNDDTIIVSNPGAYRMFQTYDVGGAAFATNAMMRYVDFAVQEYRDWVKTAGPRPNVDPVELNTGHGRLIVSGSGADAIPGGGFLTLDFGGNDRYSGLIGTPVDETRPISLVLDFGGNDTYDGTSVDGNIGCGMLGLGAVCDFSGDDVYRIKNGGIGFGLYGAGIVYDAAGDDTYEAATGWAQGAAYCGIGLLVDLEGKDKYRSVTMSMGFGGSFGVGALVDVKGNDDYYTADKGSLSVAWGGKTTSMCLGSGYGRRSDSGDGQNQAGGIGIVVEGAGDDKYFTAIFSLGSGYYWGAGFFEERGGNDTYRFTHYCLGSGAHFAIGSFVDLAGNDKYNDRPDAVERWGGLGRDGSIAVCYDAAGDDVWGNLTGGHSDLNSIALFWDKEGDDVYKRMQPFDPTQMGNRPFGSAAPYTEFRSFRDHMASVGIFLDTAGADTYPSGMTAAENQTWMLQKGPMFWGLGFDGSAR